MKRRSRQKNTITVRQAIQRDIETLVNQRRKMFEDIRGKKDANFKQGDSVYRKWTRRMWKERRFLAFVAENGDGTAIGGGCVWIRERQPSPGSGYELKEPYLMSMYTDPKYRGLGIASQIVKKAMNWCRKMGYSRMMLHASKYGKPVYKKLGWERTWEMRVVLKRDAKR